MLSVDEIKGVDRDISRRPGYQLYRPVEPWPFTRHPPTQQAGKPAVPRKPTPVFGTSCPPRGLSGIIRTAAYRVPDHLPRKWLLLLLADRVEATGPRLRRLLTYGAPVLLAGLASLGGAAKRRRGRGGRRGRRFVARTYSVNLPSWPSW